jgi:hypothetical protein
MSVCLTERGLVLWGGVSRESKISTGSFVRYTRKMTLSSGEKVEPYTIKLREIFHRSITASTFSTTRTIRIGSLRGRGL